MRVTRSDTAAMGVVETSIDRESADKQEFEDFYRREFPGVVALAYVLSGSNGAAEDLAQEGFVAAHRRWEEIGRYDDPGAWVRKVVSNMAVSAIRRRVAEAKAVLRLRSQPPPAAAFIAAEHGEVWAAVRSLPRKQAQAVALRYLEGWSVSEIAGALECAEATVKVHLHRARRTLAGRLGLEDGEVADER